MWREEDDPTVALKYACAQGSGVTARATNPPLHVLAAARVLGHLGDSRIANGILRTGL